MCGFFVIVKKQRPVSKELLDDCLEVLKRRGPDASAIVCEQVGTTSVTLGHTRLAIISPSSRSNQPFGDGTDSLVFNGEIYNFRDLKAQVGRQEYGVGDTEVLFHGLKLQGVDFLKSVDGPFSFCFLDRVVNKILFARDVFGEKPLYYGVSGELICISSDLDVVRKCISSGEVEVSYEWINHFLRTGKAHPYLSAIKDIYKVRPGEFGVLDLVDLRLECKYFVSDLDQHASFYLGRQSNSVDIIESILTSSVEARMGADVNIALFLSGGVDSALTAALASRAKSGIDAFCLSFQGYGIDESSHAQRIAETLGLKFNRVELGRQEFEEAAWNLSSMIDEPSGDISLIPTAKLSAHVSKQYKVVLTGDGADELFGGYPYYYDARVRLALLMNRLIPKRIKSMLQLKDHTYPSVSKLVSIVTAEDPASIFYSIVGNSTINGESSCLGFWLENALASTKNDREMLQLCDLMLHLPSGILRKLDRATMQFGLEARTPYLNIQLVKALFNRDYRGRSGKLALTDILSKYIPLENLVKSKNGFVPDKSVVTNEICADYCETGLNLIKNSHLVENKFIRCSSRVKNMNPELSWNFAMLGHWLRARQII